MLVQLVGGGELLEPTGMKHRHPVAQIERLLLLVRDEHGRDPDPFDERPQLAPRALPQARVQVRERLLPKQHPRLPRPRARPPPAPLPPPPQLPHAPPRPAPPAPPRAGLPPPPGAPPPPPHAPSGTLPPPPA